MKKPTEMYWGNETGAWYRGADYYVGLTTFEDWMNALRSIWASIPDAFKTEDEALIMSRNMPVLHEQIRFFALKPLVEETDESRSYESLHLEINPTQSQIRIPQEQYQALMAAFQEIANTRSIALIRSEQCWQLSKAETALDCLGVAINQMINEKAPREKLLQLLWQAHAMMWRLTDLERERDAMHADPNSGLSLPH